jgi:hypothetical protein
MTSDFLSLVPRRDFLKAAGATLVLNLTHSALAAPGGKATILVDAADPVASSAPVKRAAEQLRKAMVAKGVSCEMAQSADQAKGSTLCIVVAPGSSALAKGFAGAAHPMDGVESVRMTPGTVAGAQAILISGGDALGFIYGLMELAERVQFNTDFAAGLRLAGMVEEKPANEIRSVGRYFCSELHDKTWYYDKDFWRGYLDILVTSRFNRFNFGYGIEYDFPRGVTSDYLHFAYPYLVAVPGYENVRVMQLAKPDGTRLATPVALSVEEREKNFEMLKFIAAETGARGLHFQLGIWTHAYQWTDSPNAYHNIEGLTPENHAAYSRDALAIILKECPEIQGLTMRVHGESGIPEGSYPFWKTLFEAISGCGRKIEIDMHAKGVNQTMIDIASATGMPVKLGAKYSAEHQSLGYQQSDIRAIEVPNPNQKDNGLFSLSAGSRLFTRYGYGDFLKTGSKYKVLFRLWPGTQRHLLSADPEMAAAYGRTSHLCGAVGMDLMEPLTFKGREGSGQPGGRLAYADESLNTKADWQKYEYYYRIWGRCLYNPSANPESWRRYLRSEFGGGALLVEATLANAGRQLALVTSAHLCSASNHDWWPEINENVPIVIGSEPAPFRDTPDPKCFGTVSPLDPQMFSTVVEYVGDVLAGRAGGKYSPIEVAQWLEDYADASMQALAAARTKVSSATSPGFRRIEEDVLIQNGLGRFFASQMRSAVLYEIFVQTGNAEAGKAAVAQYKKARDKWATMAERAKKVYRTDVSYGRVPLRRGHWADRLPNIDKDMAAMETKIQSPGQGGEGSKNAAKAVQIAMGKPVRLSVACQHTVPASFHPGAPLSVSFEPKGEVTSVVLHYRHVDQAERWVSMEIPKSQGGYKAEIPGQYTDSEFPLQYYFELRRGTEHAWFYPGFNATLSNQPYYAVTNRT